VTRQTGTPDGTGDPAPVGPVSEAGRVRHGVGAAGGRPRIGTGVEEGIAAVAMALVCLITFGNVLVRYLTNVSFAFTRGVLGVPAGGDDARGASAAFARNRHIRMEYFVGKLPVRGRHAVEVLVTACGIGSSR